MTMDAQRGKSPDITLRSLSCLAGTLGSNLSSVVFVLQTLFEALSVLGQHGLVEWWKILGDNAKINSYMIVLPQNSATQIVSTRVAMIMF